MIATFLHKSKLFNLVSPRSSIQIQDMHCWWGVFSMLKTSCHFSLLMWVIQEPSVLCFEFFFCLCLEQQKLSGAGSWGLLQFLQRKLSSMWCSWVARRAPWETEQLLWISFWEIRYLYGFACLLVCLNLSWLQSWMSHVSLPHSNLLLHRCLVPISPTLASGNYSFLELLSSLSLHSRRNLKLFVFSRVVLRKSLKLQHLSLLPV